MPLRMIEMVLPERLNYKLRDILVDHSFIDVWYEDLHDDKGVMVRGLLQVEDTEKLLDMIANHTHEKDVFRVVIQPVEATLPRPPESLREEEKKKHIDRMKVRRVSSEELYEDLKGISRLSWIFVIMAVLSALVASIGIFQDNVPVIIGAMVIAPLLAPNVGLSLATALGDPALGLRSALCLGAGIGLSLATALLFGLLLPIPDGLPYVERVGDLSLNDLALALCAGLAGTLAYTSAISSALVGVMVAVALLPPLVACGMLLGSLQLIEAGKTFLLFLANLICINLAGVLVFQLQGIRPLSWWKADKANKAMFWSLVIWGAMLAGLLAIIFMN